MSTARDLLLQIIEHPGAVTITSETQRDHAWLKDNGWINNTATSWIPTPKALDAAPDFLDDAVLVDPTLLGLTADEEQQMSEAFGRVDGLTREEERVVLFLFRLHKEVPFNQIVMLIKRSKAGRAGVDSSRVPQGPEWTFACEMYKELTGG
jgi:hypothetical protein